MVKQNYNKMKSSELVAFLKAKKIFRKHPRLVISDTTGFPESKDRIVEYVLLSFDSLKSIIQRKE